MDKALGLLILFVFALTILAGCSRVDYRLRADRDAQHLLASRETDPLWRIPARPVEAVGHSRLSDPNNPDCSPLPPDDPNANHLMRHPGCTYNYDYDGIPVSSSIENYEYLNFLPKDSQGQIEITPESAIELSLVHNRDYQTQFEQIYLNALSLSGNRFEFATQWNGGGGVDYRAAGIPPNDSSLLALSDRFGFQRQFARGGQFATNMANTMSWQFADGQFSSAGGSIVAALTLPLLRGACRYVRLEGLIQAERDLLYQVRNFARFRRQFYFDVLNSYYSLLGQVQSIRNTKINLDSLELNLLEHQELLDRKMVSQIQVDQVFQQYQSGRLSLLSAEQSLADSYDRFKFQLGLPTWAKINIDEKLLQQFEFTSPELEKLQADISDLYSELLSFLPPNVPDDAKAKEFFDRYTQLLERIEQKFPIVKQEFQNWQKHLETFNEETAEADDRLDITQQKQIARQLSERFDDLESSIKEDFASLEDLRRSTVDLESIRHEELYNPEIPVEVTRWNRIQRAVGRRLREHVSELYVAEIQSRVFVIDLEPVRLNQETAMQFAVENRLDLMNSRAQVVDAYRRVEVAANALKSQLDVRAAANIGTDPGRNNPLGFDASASSYTISADFDGPLNRFNERNAYRAAQVAYQQARRQYMATEDSLLNTIRADLRQLRIQRLNFQIARQQLIAATRQVDEAQINLRTATSSNTNLTRDLLQFLQGLLDSKNNLIRSWIGYQTSRIALFVDLELLYLDEQGTWINEAQSLNELQSLIQGIDERAELSELYGILRSPLFQTTEGELEPETSKAEPEPSPDENKAENQPLDNSAAELTEPMSDPGVEPASLEETPTDFPVTLEVFPTSLPALTNPLRATSKR
jgi:outer membrane protein TolC